MSQITDLNLQCTESDVDNTSIISIPVTSNPTTTLLMLQFRKIEERGESSADWISQFCQAIVFELILAGHASGYSTLIDGTCKHVANLIKGKTPEEIRLIFNIKNDFTPEEEEAVRKENEWCEER